MHVELLFLSLGHAAPPWLLVGMYDLMFLTCEILQSRPYTLWACWICCSQPVRSYSIVLIPCMHDGSVVRSDVPYPWDLAAPSWYALRSGVPNSWDLAAPYWYLVGMCDLLFQTRETPRRYVQSGVSNPWDPEVHSWYIVGMYDL